MMNRQAQVITRGDVVMLMMMMNPYAVFNNLDMLIDPNQ